MKKLLFLSLIVSAAVPAVADQCLSASQITLTQGPSGNFILNLPANSGYTFAGQSLPFTESGPISFSYASVPLTTSSGRGQALHALTCLYLIDQGQGGNFVLMKDGSEGEFFTLTSSWVWGSNGYYTCTSSDGQESECLFTIGR